jgi:hypothetical protein
MSSHRLRIVFTVGAIAASLAMASCDGQLPAEHAGTPEQRSEEAAAVTADNLARNERFWPYRAALIRPWQPPEAEQPLRAGSVGVLIRFEPPTVARLDFGRDGLYEVPLGETDVVERANRVRRGETQKVAPNFVYAIGPRLLEPTPDEPRPLSMTALGDPGAFLCVFADWSQEELAELAASLAPLQEHPDLLTILFPQGGQRDAEVAERLRTLGWIVPFVYDHLSEPYTRTLLRGDESLPYLMLNTPEGRVLFERSWSPEAVADLRAALDQASADTH